MRPYARDKQDVSLALLFRGLQIMKRSRYEKVPPRILGGGASFPSGNSACGCSGSVSYPGKYIPVSLGECARAHGYWRFRQASCSPRPQPDRAYGGAFDGWSETLQGRLRRMPWHAGNGPEE